MRNIGGGKIMAYKLIACDMDETLLNDNHIICQRNIDLIKRAKKEYGVKFVQLQEEVILLFRRT